MSRYADMTLPQVTALICVAETTIKEAREFHTKLLNLGVSEEQARIHLPPPHMYTVLEDLDERLVELTKETNA